MHEPRGPIAFSMNKVFHEGLSDWGKAVIHTACVEHHANIREESMALNGVHLKRLNLDRADVVRDEFGLGAADAFEEALAHSDLALRIGGNFQVTRRQLGGATSKFEYPPALPRNRVIDLRRPVFGMTLLRYGIDKSSAPPSRWWT